MKRIIPLILSFVIISSTAYAGSGDVRLSAIAGHNASFGILGGAEASASYDFSSLWRLNGAVRYATHSMASIDVRPAFTYDLNCGRLKVEAIAQYSHLASTNDICAGITAGLHTKWVWLSAGYCYRMFYAQGSSLHEPLNLLYELGVSFLPNSDRWDLYFIISNSRMARVERAFQPSYILECEYSPVCNLGIILSAETKRAGIFNIASVNYQNLLSIGVRYRW
jgi:hypothetical protein